MLQRDKPIRHGKTKPHAAKVIKVISSWFTGFLACRIVLTFAVIGHNTKNILKIFLVFKVLLASR